MINLEKLTNSKRVNGAVVAQCPACAAAGRDLKGKNHLSVLPNGKFNCVVDSSTEHRNLILKLVGLDPNNLEIELPEYKQPIPEVEKIYPRSILDGLVKDHSYYTDKGIKESVLVELMAGKAFKGNMAGRYVFPIVTLDGRIHGFSGRALYENPQFKWKHMGIKSNWVYPAHFVHDDIRRERSVILVESIGDLIALMSAGIRNVLVLFGTNLHGELLSYLIARSPNKIYVATNKDFPKIVNGITRNIGQEAAEKIANKLHNYFGSDKIETKFPIKKDFGEMTEEEIKLWRNELC